MIISDISHIEVATEDNKIQGGIAFADADAYAKAVGKYFAAADTYTSTKAVSGYYYSAAKASSGSSSTAY